MDNNINNNEQPPVIIPYNNQNDQFTLTFDGRTLKKAAGWITFWCVIQIIGGISTCITIIGIPLGVFNLMGAFKLLSISENLKNVAATNNLQSARQALEDLHPVFKNFGIAVIISIIFTIIIYIVVILIIIFAVQGSGNLLNEFLNGGYYYY